MQHLLIKYSLIGSGILFLFLIPADLIFQDEVPVCMFRHFTGIECPLCGMTRACYCIVHLKAAEALALNPAVFFLPVVLASEIVHDTCPSPLTKKRRRVVLLIFISGLALLFIIRIVQYLACK